MISSGQGSGYQIITPFQLETGERILVNRGWVTNNKRNPKKRMEGQIEDTMEIRGIVRKQEEKPGMMPDVHDTSGLEWHYRDVSSFATILDTLPVCIDADSEGTGKGGPIGGQTPVHLRNEHMQYILTWFGISLFSSILIWKFKKF